MVTSQPFAVQAVMEPSLWAQLIPEPEDLASLNSLLRRFGKNVRPGFWGWGSQGSWDWLCGEGMMFIFWESLGGCSDTHTHICHSFLNQGEKRAQTYDNGDLSALSTVQQTL